MERATSTGFYGYFIKTTLNNFIDKSITPKSIKESISKNTSADNFHINEQEIKAVTSKINIENILKSLAEEDITKYGCMTNCSYAVSLII